MFFSWLLYALLRELPLVGCGRMRESLQMRSPLQLATSCASHFYLIGVEELGVRAGREIDAISPGSLVRVLRVISSFLWLRGSHLL
jgi:hypothetical protein